MQLAWAVVSCKGNYPTSTRDVHSGQSGNKGTVLLVDVPVRDIGHVVRGNVQGKGQKSP